MSNNSDNGKYKVIGTRPVRHDGAEKVMGKAIYGAGPSQPSCPRTHKIH